MKLKKLRKLALQNTLALKTMALTQTAKQVHRLDAEQGFNEPIDIYNRMANWALAQLEGKAVRLTADDQRKLLGFVVGKGRVSIEYRDGRYLAFNWVTCCFGTDITCNGVFDVATTEKVH